MVKNTDERPTSRSEWNLSKIPPAGDEDVGPFVWQCFEDSKDEKERLLLPERWQENHRIFRAQHWRNQNVFTRQGRHKISLGIFFSNVMRTVANITAKDPTAEVKDMDGFDDEADSLLSSKIRAWYNETEQSRTLEKSVLSNEIYGVTFEKYRWDPDKERPDTIVLDPYAAFPAPGYYEDINDMPYFIHAYPMLTSDVEVMFGLNPGTVKVDEVYSIMGEEREEHGPTPVGRSSKTQNYPSNYVAEAHPTIKPAQYRESRALVVECWIRDYSMVRVPEVDQETGQAVETYQTIQKYPGAIRKITVCNQGNLVLDDRSNPNINYELPLEQSEQTYLFSSFPFSKANSYEDTVDIWGFSAFEQSRSLLMSLDEIISRMVQHLARATKPTLVCPQDTKISTSDISNEPGLLLRPARSDQAKGIFFLPMPELPRSAFEVFNLLISMFDRVWAIEDVDRGEQPGQVVAASAVQMLQERNAVLMRAKIRAVDFLVRQRGRAAISFYQNFGTKPEVVEVNEEPREVVGVQLAGRNFKYMVESGSTYAKTMAKVQEDAIKLYQLGAIDRQALLETLNFPGWQQIIERVGEGQLAQAIQVLIQAGMPEQEAVELQEVLKQQQGGPGNRQQRPNQDGRTPPPESQGGQPQPGTPRANQGRVQ